MIRLLFASAAIPVSIVAQVSSSGSPAIGPVGPVQAQSQTPANARDDQPQEAGSTQGIPAFRSEARLVLITAGVWKRAADKQPDESLVPADVLRRYPGGIFLGPSLRYAKRLDTRITQSDFHVFDNGIEQRISYFRKTVSPMKDESKEYETSWRFHPKTRGTWGFPPGYFHPMRISGNGPLPPGLPLPPRAMFGPDIAYVIGYVPPALERGKCHDVRVEVENHDVGLDRNQYCGADGSHGVDEATGEGTEVGTKMRAFGDSEAIGSIKVSARGFAFWSSRVSYFMSQNAAGGSTAPGPDLNLAVEARGPNAPARVHVAVEFAPPQKGWILKCGQKAEALHVLGIAYKENHQIAGQFGDTFTCNRSELARKKIEIMQENGSTEYDEDSPNRLDAQMDLVPGDYDLRVVVRKGDKEFGRARVPLHVESFDGQQLTTSDVVLSSFPRDASKALDDAVVVSPAQLVPAPLISKNIQFLPDTDTHIARHTRLPLYFEIYEPFLKQQTTGVYMHLRVTNLRTGSVVLDSGVMSAANWALPGNPVIPVGFSLGTQNLDKGNYRVDVQATDAAGEASAFRQANFTVD